MAQRSITLFFCVVITLAVIAVLHVEGLSSTSSSSSPSSQKFWKRASPEVIAAGFGVSSVGKRPDSPRLGKSRLINKALIDFFRTDLNTAQFQKLKGYVKTNQNDMNAINVRRRLYRSSINL
jgi:hypothetical protein